MAGTEQLESNCALKWDYRLGFRGFGLIAYGALPASLGALGAFKAPGPDSLHLGGYEIPFVVMVAAVPVLLTFVLTRQRLASWYTLDDYLLMRSWVITIGIVVASTAVCLATRVLSKEDVGVAFQQWWALPFWIKTNTIGRALLLSFAYLVGSSTLFLTVIKEDSTLPLLPPKDRVMLEGALRKHLRTTAAAAKAFPRDVPNSPLADRAAELIAAAGDATDTLRQLDAVATRWGRTRFNATLRLELSALQRALENVRNVGATAWDYYWAEPEPAGLNTDQLEMRALIRRHGGLRVGV